MADYQNDYLRACKSRDFITRDDLLKNHAASICIYCSKCQDMKTADNFYLISNARSAKGVKSYCKSCSNKYNTQKQYTLKNYNKKKNQKPENEVL